MSIFLHPGFSKPLPKAAVAVSLWLLLLAFATAVAHVIVLNPDHVYKLMWHGGAAHAALCVPFLALALPVSISALILVGLLYVYSARLLNIAQEVDKLKTIMSPGPLFEVALASKLGPGTLHKVVYVVLLVSFVSPWLVATETLIEMAATVGAAFVATIIIFSVYALRGPLAFLNPIPRIKKILDYIASRRLGDQFDLLPYEEKEAFRREAALVGMSVHNKEFQLAAVQVYDEKRKKAELEARELTMQTPAATRVLPKNRL